MNGQIKVELDKIEKRHDVVFDNLIIKLNDIDKTLNEYQIETKNNIKELLELNERNTELLRQLESKLERLANKPTIIDGETIFVGKKFESIFLDNKRRSINE